MRDKEGKERKKERKPGAYKRSHRQGGGEKKRMREKKTATEGEMWRCVEEEMEEE